MAASSEDINTLRRMVGDAGRTTFSDQQLADVIVRYPLADTMGEYPVLGDGTENPAWTATYDLNHAAADVWAEKALQLAAEFDFSTDGQTFSRSQAFEQMMKLSRYFLARRAVGTIRQESYPLPGGQLPSSGRV